MMRAVTKRWIALALSSVIGVLGCGGRDEERPENPPPAVPGMVVTPAPAVPVGMPSGAPPVFDPPLAVPGHPSPIPPPPVPAMPTGMMPTQPVSTGPIPGQPSMQQAAMMQPGQAMPAGPIPGQPSMQQAAMMQPGQAMPVQPGTSPLTLAQGFLPDPAVARGMATGSMPASSLSSDPSCVGFVPSQPSHVVTLSTAIPHLRVLVSSSADTVLAIRRPDGTFLCNDDTEQGVVLNPTIQGAFAPGTYTIWVGVWNPETPPAPYVIGFTEMEHVTHEMLGT
jgi:hypothetical protein